MKNGKRMRVAALLTAVVFLLCMASAAMAVTATVTVNGEQQEYPEAVFDPALVGTWSFHDEITDSDIVWVFNADGTGSYDMNGVLVPINSIVMTDEPYSEKAEDGVRVTVYFGEYTYAYEGESYTLQIGPMDYGFSLQGDTLQICFDPELPISYQILTRE